MNQRPKGGEVVIDKESGCAFVSMHTRSKLFRPIPHTNGSGKFIRVESENMGNLFVVNKENTPFICLETAFDQMKQAVNYCVGKNYKVESVFVPDVSMEKGAKLLLIAVNQKPVKVVAASLDENLKELFDRTAATMNAAFKNEQKNVQQDSLNGHTKNELEQLSAPTAMRMY